jgi:HD-GYP domain-containing protein (c-di-GMP phosphodiesterase class II)
MDKSLEINTINVDSKNTYYNLMKRKENLEIINVHRSDRTALYFFDRKDDDHFLMVIILSGEVELTYKETKKTLKQNDYFYYEKLDDLVKMLITESANFLIITSMEFYRDMYESFKKGHEIIDLIDQKDNYTKGHCDRVTQLAAVIARKLNFSNKRFFNFTYGAFFHDLGKIKISNEILNKKGKLNEEEFAEMKKHPKYSQEIFLDNFKHLERDYDCKLISDIIIQHHERLDGSGYPMGLKSDEILLEAKIVAVCDSFDAMATDRPYKKKKSKKEALKELKELSGTKYDSDMVNYLEEVLDELYDELYQNDDKI